MSTTPSTVFPKNSPATVLVFKVLICIALACVTLVFQGCTSRTDLTWVEESSYRWAALDIPAVGKAGFSSRIPAKTGITFQNTLSEEAFLANRHYVNGSGVALGDIDGDGWVDIYFAHLEGPNTLYKNTGGWKFKDITEQAGVGVANQFSTGAVFADVDGDHDLDLLVTALGSPNLLFINDGAGNFAKQTLPSALNPDTGSTTMALADIDGDNDLDLYVGNYKKISVKDIYPPPLRSFEATVYQDAGEYKIKEEFAPHFKLRIEANRLARFEYAEPDEILLNDGAGNFSPLSFTDGLFLDEDGVPFSTALNEWALAARFQDVNGDGAPDLYICNDFESPDRLWINQGDGSFRLVDRLALRKTSGSSMSVDFSDVDRDGDTDFFVADMLYTNYSERQVQLGMETPPPTRIGEIENRPEIMQNMLMLNRGDGSFADIANLSGVEASGWTWASAFMDVDLDGYEDLLMTTGHHYDAMDSDVQRRIRSTPMSRDWRKVLLFFPPLDQPNAAFRNKGDLTFEMMPAGWGLGASSDVAHGMALADLDNDGDLDVITNRLKDTAGVYENTSAASRIAVRLKGAGNNTQGIGAKIRLYGGAVDQQEKEVSSGGLYLSGSDLLCSFATGDRENGLTLEVTWRSGKQQRIENIRPNRIYEVFE